MKIVGPRDELIAQWREEGDALPLVRHLMEREELDAVAVVCQLALDDEEDAERRAELQRFFAETGKPPATWDDALVEFAVAPSVEAWEELFQWVPLEAMYYRTKTSIRRLRELGVDPDILFRCASRWGTTPSAIELGETGEASPEVILERGRGMITEPFFVALAAVSAAARGEQSRAVWLGNKALGMGGIEEVTVGVDFQLDNLVALLDDDHRALLRFSPFETD